MKILWKGFLATNMSWSIVAQNISRSLINLGHQVDLFSTNGILYFPEDLKPNLIGYGENNTIISGKYPDKSYDVCLSYTALKNFTQYLNHTKANKNRFGIWAYEYCGKNALPYGFTKHHNGCDYLLAPSQFAKQIFLDSGFPEEKIIVVPHGINNYEITSAIPYKLKTKKNSKILINLGQVHKRKGLDIALEMFGVAFNKNDDVCLVLKIQDKKLEKPFEASFQNIYSQFVKKFPNHAEVEIIKEFIPNIYSLYKSCDIMFSATHCEAFGMPHLEALAMGLINVCPRYGGMLDFLNDDNSLLIDGKEFKVPGEWLYYQNKLGTIAFMPDVNDGINKLRLCVENKEYFKKKLDSFIPNSEKFDWTNISNCILELVK